MSQDWPREGTSLKPSGEHSLHSSVLCVFFVRRCKKCQPLLISVSLLCFTPWSALAHGVCGVLLQLTSVCVAGTGSVWPPLPGARASGVSVTMWGGVR